MTYALAIFANGETFYVGSFDSRPDAIAWAKANLQEPHERFEVKRLLTYAEWIRDFKTGEIP